MKKTVQMIEFEEENELLDTRGEWDVVSSDFELVHEYKE
jgi:hypothetical protein